MLVEMMEPQVEVEMTPVTDYCKESQTELPTNWQQTPKPAAQWPSELPPAEEHSEEVKQVPLMLKHSTVPTVRQTDTYLASEKAVHALLPNLTMEKSENCPEQSQIISNIE